MAIHKLVEMSHAFMKNLGMGTNSTVSFKIKKLCFSNMLVSFQSLVELKRLAVDIELSL